MCADLTKIAPIAKIAPQTQTGSEEILPLSDDVRSTTCIMERRISKGGDSRHF
jgi:hypothetical protein